MYAWSTEREEEYDVSKVSLGLKVGKEQIKGIFIGRSPGIWRSQ
jgi:hypothetical protein